jgi:hypothetical protein
MLRRIDPGYGASFGAAIGGGIGDSSGPPACATASSPATDREHIVKTTAPKTCLLFIPQLYRTAPREGVARREYATRLSNTIVRMPNPHDSSVGVNPSSV